MKYYYVYILLCSDSSYYVGVTGNLERRLSEHQMNLIKGCYTSSRLPVKLVWHGIFNDIRYAIVFEKQVKRLEQKEERSFNK